MLYDPKSIANYFISAAKAEGRVITPLQVIKLVYIAHGWHLGQTGQPLINEAPEAWQYGPVIPSLYHSLKEYGNGGVESLVSTAVGTWPSIQWQIASTPSDPGIVQFLQSVWMAYGKFSGIQLSNLTHQNGTPWHQTWEDRNGKNIRGTDIPTELITEHYRSLKEKYNAGK